eukprot:9324653-Alexandrium_andersonii.AAC.1
MCAPEVGRASLCAGCWRVSGGAGPVLAVPALEAEGRTAPARGSPQGVEVGLSPPPLLAAPAPAAASSSTASSPPPPPPRQAAPSSQLEAWRPREAAPSGPLLRGRADCALQ